MKKLPKINTAKLLKAALPYIFIGLMATKLGQAYRMVPEGDVLDKALGALLNIGTVFQNPLPSFHPFDLIVGAVCGVLIWFIVYQKSKNARKYRRGAEYGPAPCPCCGMCGMGAATDPDDEHFPHGILLCLDDAA